MAITVKNGKESEGTSMKFISRFRRREDNFVEIKTLCSKCLAKDIKLSSFLGGIPSRILIFIVRLILLNFVCLKF